jgi:hypothetical protein
MTQPPAVEQILSESPPDDFMLMDIVGGGCAR